MSKPFPERLVPPSKDLGLGRAWHDRRDVKAPSEATKEFVLQHLRDNVVIVSPKHGLTEAMAEHLRSQRFLSKDGDKDCFKRNHSEQGSQPEAGMRLDSGVFCRVSAERSPCFVLLDPFDTETFVILHWGAFRDKPFDLGGEVHNHVSCFLFHIKRDKDWKGADAYDGLLGTRLVGGVLFPHTSNFCRVYFSAGLLLHVIESDDTSEASMMVHDILDSESGSFLVKGHWTVQGSWLLFTDRDYDGPFNLYCLNLWSLVHSVAFVHQLGEISDRQALIDLDLSAFSGRKKIEAAVLEHFE